MTRKAASGPTLFDLLAPPAAAPVATRPAVLPHRDPEPPPPPVWPDPLPSAEVLEGPTDRAAALAAWRQIGAIRALAFGAAEQLRSVPGGAAWTALADQAAEILRWSLTVLQEAQQRAAVAAQMEEDDAHVAYA